MNQLHTLDQAELERVEGGGVLLVIGVLAVAAFAVGVYAGYTYAHEG